MHSQRLAVSHSPRRDTAPGGDANANSGVEALAQQLRSMRGGGGLGLASSARGLSSTTANTNRSSALASLTPMAQSARGVVSHHSSSLAASASRPAPPPPPPPALSSALPASSTSSNPMAAFTTTRARLAYSQAAIAERRQALSVAAEQERLRRERLARETGKDADDPSLALPFQGTNYGMLFGTEGHTGTEFTRTPTHVTYRLPTIGGTNQQGITRSSGGTNHQPQRYTAEQQQVIMTRLLAQHLRARTHFTQASVQVQRRIEEGMDVDDKTMVPLHTKAKEQLARDEAAQRKMLLRHQRKMMTAREASSHDYRQWLASGTAPSDDDDSSGASGGGDGDDDDGTVSQRSFGLGGGRPPSAPSNAGTPSIKGNRRPSAPPRSPSSSLRLMAMGSAGMRMTSAGSVVSLPGADLGTQQIRTTTTSAGRRRMGSSRGRMGSEEISLEAMAQNRESRQRQRRSKKRQVYEEVKAELEERRRLRRVEKQQARLDRAMALGIRESDLPPDDEGQGGDREEAQRQFEEEAPLRDLMRLQAQEDALASSVSDDGDDYASSDSELADDEAAALRAIAGGGVGGVGGFARNPLRPVKADVAAKREEIREIRRAIKRHLRGTKAMDGEGEGEGGQGKAHRRTKGGGGDGGGGDALAALRAARALVEDVERRQRLKEGAAEASAQMQRTPDAEEHDDDEGSEGDGGFSERDEEHDHDDHTEGGGVIPQLHRRSSSVTSGSIPAPLLTAPGSIDGAAAAAAAGSSQRGSTRQMRSTNTNTNGGGEDSVRSGGGGGSRRSARVPSSRPRTANAPPPPLSGQCPADYAPPEEVLRMLYDAKEQRLYRDTLGRGHAEDLSLPPPFDGVSVSTISESVCSDAIDIIFATESMMRIVNESARRNRRTASLDADLDRATKASVKAVLWVTEATQHVDRLLRGLGNMTSSAFDEVVLRRRQITAKGDELDQAERQLDRQKDEIHQMGKLRDELAKELRLKQSLLAIHLESTAGRGSRAHSPVGGGGSRASSSLNTSASQPQPLPGGTNSSSGGGGGLGLLPPPSPSRRAIGSASSSSGGGVLPPRRGPSPSGGGRGSPSASSSATDDPFARVVAPARPPPIAVGSSSVSRPNSLGLLDDPSRSLLPSYAALLEDDKVALQALSRLRQLLGKWAVMAGPSTNSKGGSGGGPTTAHGLSGAQQQAALSPLAALFAKSKAKQQQHSNTTSSGPHPTGSAKSAPPTASLRPVEVALQALNKELITRQAMVSLAGEAAELWSTPNDSLS